MMAVESRNAPITFPFHPLDLPDGECHAAAGYCAGFPTEDGRWLTVLGSAGEYVPLFATRERAAAWAVHKGWARVRGWDEHAVRWVQRSGSYFRVSEPVRPDLRPMAMPARGIRPGMQLAGQRGDAPVAAVRAATVARVEDFPAHEVTGRTARRKLHLAGGDVVRVEAGSVLQVVGEEVRFGSGGVVRAYIDPSCVPGGAR